MDGGKEKRHKQSYETKISTVTMESLPCIDEL